MLKKLPIQIFLLALVFTSNASPRPSEKAYTDLVPNYDLSVNILPEAQRLEVSGTVQVPAVKSSQELVPLLLSEQMRDFRVEVVRPVASAGLAKVEAKGKGSGRVFYTVTPPKPFAPNEPILLRFSYVGGEKGVVIDPRFLLPRWTPEYRADADAIKRCSQK